MTRKKYSIFHSLIQKFASTHPGTWLFSRTLHHFDRAFLKLTNNKTTLTSILAGVPIVILTSTGAKSGLPRNVPILCIRDESKPSRIAIVASNWGQKHHPAWYFNLKANPRATCSIAGQAGGYIAHEAEGEEYDKFWQAAMDTYLGFPLYQERAGDRHIPIMIMTLIE